MDRSGSVEGPGGRVGPRAAAGGQQGAEQSAGRPRPCPTFTRTLQNRDHASLRAIRFERCDRSRDRRAQLWRAAETRRGCRHARPRTPRSHAAKSRRAVDARGGERDSPGPMPPRGGRPARPSPRDSGPLLPFEGAPASGAAARRVFLGWERPVLHAAADWILRELGGALGDVLVAVPGARAARRLRELLAERAPRDWTPPRVLTQGELIDELVRLARPAAGRLTRTLVWERALESLPRDELARLQRRRNGAGADERLRLAETVRTLHGELAPEGRDFAALAREGFEADLEAEALRWTALGHAQQRYRELLVRLARVDPHEGRAQAVEAGEIDATRRIVLVGVADMNQLLARTLAAVAARTSVLVAAPADLADGFDALGRLRTAFWQQRDVPLALADWRVAEKPVDQAESVRAVLDEWRGTLAPDELTLGVADESVIPYLERQLAECGAATRRAAGTALELTRPYRLLRALARFLRRGGFRELAALARDPDLGAALAVDGDPALRFDAYFVEHLPRHARDWLGDRPFEQAVRAFQQRLEQGLGPLAARAPRPLAGWSEPIRAWLARVYPGPFHESNEHERVLCEALRSVGAVLGELEEVPASLELAALGPAEALELLVRTLRGQRIPPPPRAAADGANAAGDVELVGWLDLPLDDAPALILTGFNEGKVPQSLGAHAFLPDALRQRLQLPSDAERLARDVYAATVILQTRARHVFVSARRSAEGDPQVPSRIAFHRPEAEIPARVLRFLPPEDAHAARLADEDAGPNHACPVLPGWTVPKRLGVSAFRLYLSSPYSFYLEQVLRLETRDDRMSELDPRGFGNLAHKVLEELGGDGPHASTDADEVADFLAGALARRAAATFGSEPLPAVGLQLAQLEHRLRAFAGHQAARAAEGWRIHAIEWKPPAPVLLDVDGVTLELTAKIDRIDRHPDGRWAILDYKTGEKQKRPHDAHRRKSGEWIDLQLPLYCFAARALGFAGEPELGYARIGKDESDTGFLLERFEESELAEALEVAREIVRSVRAGRFHEPGRLPYDEIFQAIFGLSTLGAEPGEPGE